jgi:hypothetical protein
MVGGFFVRATGVPLGELRIDGTAHRTVRFVEPWDARRACVHAVDGGLVIACREEIEREPPGDLLQAGPLLVRDRRPCVEGDREGFAAGSHQFDTDITRGRYPRAGIGVRWDGSLLAVACDGRADDDAGLTFPELAETMVRIGAERAINLDGGASAALVCAGRLRNSPRSDDGDVAGGRALATALIFAEHDRGHVGTTR